MHCQNHVAVAVSAGKIQVGLDIIELATRGITFKFAKPITAITSKSRYNLLKQLLFFSHCAKDNI